MPDGRWRPRKALAISGEAACLRQGSANCLDRPRVTRTSGRKCQTIDRDRMWWWRAAHRTLRPTDRPRSWWGWPGAGQDPSVCHLADALDLRCQQDPVQPRTLMPTDSRPGTRSSRGTAEHRDVGSFRFVQGAHLRQRGAGAQINRTPPRTPGGAPSGHAGALGDGGRRDPSAWSAPFFASLPHRTPIEQEGTIFPSRRRSWTRLHARSSRVGYPSRRGGGDAP